MFPHLIEATIREVINAIPSEEEAINQLLQLTQEEHDVTIIHDQAGHQQHLSISVIHLQLLFISLDFLRESLLVIS